MRFVHTRNEICAHPQTCSSTPVHPQPCLLFFLLLLLLRGHQAKHLHTSKNKQFKDRTTMGIFPVLLLTQSFHNYCCCYCCRVAFVPSTHTYRQTHTHACMHTHHTNTTKQSPHCSS
jgi:hypothetical protein